MRSGRGESLLDPAVTEKVLERVRRIATGTYTDELAQLTPQEQKILLLVAEGKTNKEIASEVFLSDKTVKNYVSSILSKLNLERRAQAAAFVAKHRIGTGADRLSRGADAGRSCGPIRPARPVALRPGRPGAHGRPLDSASCVSSPPRGRLRDQVGPAASSCRGRRPRRRSSSTPSSRGRPS